MSVYVVTRDQRCIRYEAPGPHTEWVRDSGAGYYKIYWKNCTCDNCVEDKHQSLIAFVRTDTIVSIGFRTPVTVEGRMMTATERDNLASLQTWLRHALDKHRTPQWMSQVMSVVERMLK